MNTLIDLTVSQKAKEHVLAFIDHSELEHV